MEWIKVTDKKPDNVTPVLVYGCCCDSCYQIKIAEIEDGGWFESGSGDDLVFAPSHWMSLPEPPKE